MLQAADVACVWVNDRPHSWFCTHDPIMQANGYIGAMDHFLYGPLPRHGLTVSLSRTPGVMRPVPAIGAHTLAVLSDSSPAPVLYRRALSITLSLAVVAWYRLLQRPPTPQSVDRATRAGALALVVITVLLLEVPYRLSFHNNRPVVEHAGQRCYEFGRQVNDRLVYCQAWDAPRVRVVPADAVHETGQVASPFAGSVP